MSYNNLGMLTNSHHEQKRKYSLNAHKHEEIPCMKTHFFYVTRIQLKHAYHKKNILKLIFHKRLQHKTKYAEL